MGLKKPALVIAAAAAVVISGSALAYTGPGGSTSGGSDNGQCQAIKQDFDGNLTQVDATTNDVGIDFWWRGDGDGANIENWTMLRDGVFDNTYAPLAGATWTYSSDCTPDQVDQLFATHVAERQADPTVSAGEFVPWDQTGIFVLTVGTAPMVGTNPGTISTDPVSLDAATVLASANSDDRNPYEDTAEGDCLQLSQYNEVETETATSGSNMIVVYTDSQGVRHLTMLPHGRFASNYISGLFVGLDVNCSFNDAITWVNTILQQEGLDSSALIAWEDTGLFNKINRKLAYFGVGNGDSDRESCKVGLGKEGPIQSLRRHDNRIAVDQDTWVHVQAWKTGVNRNGEQEAFVFVPAGSALVRLDNQAKGWYWLYDARYCNAGNIRSQMSDSVQRRVNHDAATNGAVENWNDASFVSLEGERMNNPFPNWFRIVDAN